MLAAPETAYRGEQIHEHTLKKVLQRLDPLIHFDLGSSLNIWHPKINRWQGVYRNGKHIAAMSRGYLPEFNLYREGHDEFGRPERREMLDIGWRTTVENVAKSGATKLSALEICIALGQEYKKFVGDPSELNIPEHKVDSIYNTAG